ncbi:MAG: hypothetical protein IPF54_13175, partial [Draconibacterium sp.]|nr:hypothetical protein [Draconibacterium sp.]
KYVPNPIPDDFYTGNEDPLSNPIGGDSYREDYFTWEWGDALFVVIEPYQYSMLWPNEGGAGYGGEGQDGEASGDRWDWTLGIEQYLWLKSTLENSSAKFKFVFSHHVAGGATNYGRGGISAAPYFEWGGKNADGTWGWDTERPASAGWDVPIHPLLVNIGVQVYFLDTIVFMPTKNWMEWSISNVQNPMMLVTHGNLMAMVTMKICIPMPLKLYQIQVISGFP